MTSEFMLVPSSADCGSIAAASDSLLLELRKQLRTDNVAHFVKPQQVEVNGLLTRLPAVHISGGWSAALASLQRILQRESRPRRRFEDALID